MFADEVLVVFCDAIPSFVVTSPTTASYVVIFTSNGGKVEGRREGVIVTTVVSLGLGEMLAISVVIDKLNGIELNSVVKLAIANDDIFLVSLNVLTAPEENDDGPGVVVFETCAVSVTLLPVGCTVVGVEAVKNVAVVKGTETFAVYGRDTEAEVLDNTRVDSGEVSAA